MSLRSEAVAWDWETVPGHWHVEGLQQEKPQHNLSLTSVATALAQLLVGDHQIHS